MAASVDSSRDYGDGEQHAGCSEDDILDQGSLTEFRGKYRCLACQDGNRICIAKKGDKSCLLCSDAQRDCIFRRFIETSISRIPWDLLVEPDIHGGNKASVETPEESFVCKSASCGCGKVFTQAPALE